MFPIWHVRAANGAERKGSHVHRFRKFLSLDFRHLSNRPFEGGRSVEMPAECPQ